MNEFAGKRSTASSQAQAQAPAHAGRPSIGKASLVEQAYVAVVQAKAAPGGPADGAEAHGPGPATGGGRPLPAELRSQMERSLGADFSAVRIHEGDEAAAVGAHAYTRGNDIYFAPGQYDPTSERGRELLGHELTHVVQQAQGRVQATAQAKGLAINADAGLEHEADTLGAKAARGEPAGGGTAGAAPSGAPAQMTLASPVIQRKGDQPLRPQADHAAAGGGAAAPVDPRITALLADLADYDSHVDGRPAQQLAAVDLMLAAATAIVASQPKPSGLKAMFSRGPARPTLAESIKAILTREHTTVVAQRDRLAKLTRNDAAPYEQMTAEGMMWNHPDYEHNTARVGSKGKTYFEDMSSRNMMAMNTEATAPGAGDAGPPMEQAWFRDFVARAVAALSTSVVNHYTTSARATAMQANGMKSKMMLEKDNATFKHNTSAYDDLGLGNSGFLFFFIEAPDAAMRPTRFAEGDDGARPARISIPIADSGLLTRGWVMLSDFAQREYPDIQTNAASDRHASWLPTRADEQKAKPEHAGMTQPVRHFTPGLGAITDADVDQISSGTMTSEQIQATMAISPQVRGDAQSKQTYSGPAGSHDVPERMVNNILTGAEIIPGLATRAALEVARMAKANPALAETFKPLDGAALMKFMLKDLFRPQAMIPNSVAVRDEHVQA